MAATVEDGTRLHHQTRSVNFAGDYGFGLNFNFAGRFDDAVEMPADDDVISVNLSFDFRVFAEDQGFVRDQIALHRGINTEGAGGLEPTLDFYALLESRSIRRNRVAYG